ncbi:linker for activation of T-cells family member 1 isoform X4 [Callorhinus ursinus]|uniref:Uncharacterized protein LOC112810299 isoform X3 n=1 Tax=Callorhinus ursinus TaxID=34884 RepID=A0A3Q7MRH1_CALUR|nr:uncharacterized protein LOC112810299 isoform X3 [Callorhinus ursinus]
MVFPFHCLRAFLDFTLLLDSLVLSLPPEALSRSLVFLSQSLLSGFTDAASACRSPRILITAGLLRAAGSGWGVGKFSSASGIISVSFERLFSLRVGLTLPVRGCLPCLVFRPSPRSPYPLPARAPTAICASASFHSWIHRPSLQLRRRHQVESGEDYVNVLESEESADVSLDGSREYVNVSQELPPMAKTEPAILSSQKVEDEDDEEEEGAPDYENL